MAKVNDAIYHYTFTLDINGKPYAPDTFPDTVSRSIDDERKWLKANAERALVARAKAYTIWRRLPPGGSWEAAEHLSTHFDAGELVITIMLPNED